MRPVNIHGDETGKLADESSEYLWGDNVLVAPVVKAGARTRKVTFPDGDWTDWNNPLKTYRGGTTATVQAPLQTLPLFVRAGSFIPQAQQQMQNTSEYDPALLTVKYFPAKEWTDYTLYDDNRLSPTSIEDGQYQLTTFSGSRQGSEIYIDISSEGNYREMPPVRAITLQIVNTGAPKGVEINGEQLKSSGSPKAISQLGYSYDKATRTLSILLPYNYTKTEIKVF